MNLNHISRVAQVSALDSFSKDPFSFFSSFFIFNLPSGEMCAFPRDWPHFQLCLILRAMVTVWATSSLSKTLGWLMTEWESQTHGPLWREDHIKPVPFLLPSLDPLLETPSLTILSSFFWHLNLFKYNKNTEQRSQEDCLGTETYFVWCISLS